MRLVLESSGSGPTQEGAKDPSSLMDVTPALTILDGPRAGACCRLDENRRTLIIGRSPEADFVIGHPTVSRKHARFFLERVHQEDRVRLTDIESRNGTFLNGLPISDAYLNPGDKVHIGDVLLRFELLDPRELDFLSNMVEKARLADYDALTGLFSRNSLAGWIEEVDQRRSHDNGVLTLIMFDIDHFKRINDTYGHQAGDLALATVGRLILANVRNGDLGIRYGGEEVLLILPGTGDSESLQVAERIRRALRSTFIPSLPLDYRITASMGLCSISPDETLEDGIRRADERAYLAKRNGRDRIEFGS